MFEFYTLKNLNPIYPLYFVYGLVFLFLGASIGIKDMKASKLKIAGNLWLLSAFGFTHGTHEWIQLFLIAQKEYLSINNFITIQIISIIVVLLSFLFLLLFGLALLDRMGNRPFYWWFQIGSVCIFFILLFYLTRYDFYDDLSLFKRVDIIIRVSFGFWGSFLAASALMVYSTKVKKISLNISRYFLLTAIGFYFYGIFAGLMFSHHKPSFLPFPVEFFRGFCAVLITYFLMKGLNIFDIETRNTVEKQMRILAQSEKMASLGQLAAGIAHEINTPLTNASLSIQMLQSKPEKYLEKDRITGKLNSIESNIDRASTIARELLRFSHIKETNFEFQDINQIAKNALSVLHYRLKDVVIKTYYGYLPKILCDADKLEQVFINILNNSIEAMGTKKVIYLSTVQVDDQITIHISDNGSGIPDEFIFKAFDPFFTTKKIGRGSGLGLSICFSIIERHQGTIELQKNKDGGTIVIINLPISKNEQN